STKMPFWPFAPGSSFLPKTQHTTRSTLGSKSKRCSACSDAPAATSATLSPRRANERATTCAPFVTMAFMNRLSLWAALLLAFASSTKHPHPPAASPAPPARSPPTAAKAEPVRDFTFYVLTRSYEDIVRDLDERDGPPSREKFIDDLKLS